MTKADGPLVVNGWSLFAHPLFLDQVEALIAKVEALEARDPKSFRQKNSSKRLAAVAKLALEVIPEDPTRAQYRLGGTLGDGRKHWFRAKFYQQYQLFFRFHTAQRIIVYAWINDEGSKRAYESSDDAYRVFSKMLDTGHPPEDWDTLLREAMVASRKITRLKSAL